MRLESTLKRLFSGRERDMQGALYYVAQLSHPRVVSVREREKTRILYAHPLLTHAKRGYDDSRRLNTRVMRVACRVRQHSHSSREDIRATINYYDGCSKGTRKSLMNFRETQKTGVCIYLAFHVRVLGKRFKTLSHFRKTPET